MKSPRLSQILGFFSPLGAPMDVSSFSPGSVFRLPLANLSLSLLSTYSSTLPFLQVVSLLFRDLLCEFFDSDTSWNVFRRDPGTRAGFSYEPRFNSYGPFSPRPFSVYPRPLFRFLSELFPLLRKILLPFWPQVIVMLSSRKSAFTDSAPSGIIEKSSPFITSDPFL